MQFQSILVAAAAFLFSGIASAAPPFDPESKQVLTSMTGDESCFISCMTEPPFCPQWGLTAVIPMTGLKPCSVKCCAFPRHHEP